jgi:hypothetical protein
MPKPALHATMEMNSTSLELRNSTKAVNLWELGEADW